MIDGLHWEHDTALNHVLAQVRTISFGKWPPSLAPLTRPVAQLVESRADSSKNHILGIEQMPPIVTELLLYGEALPLRRLRPLGLAIRRRAIGWSIWIR